MAHSEVVVFSAPSASDDFELLDDRTSAGRSVLPVETIKVNLQVFMQSVRDILPSVSAAGDYGLKTVSVAVGINGKGQVGFLGVGGEIGGTATLTLTFEAAGASAGPQGA
jgi:hypothetical protein